MKHPSLPELFVSARRLRALFLTPAFAATLLLAPATPAVANDTITIYPGVVYETFRGFGGNMARARMDTVLTDIGPNGTDVIADYCLANLNVKHVRMGIPLIVFEPSDGTFDYNADNVVNTLNLMKYIKGKGIPFVMGIWDLPDWMVSNPGATGGRLIKAGYEDKVATAIVTFLNKANTAAYNNAVPDAISFNESTETWGNNICVPSAQLNTIMTKLRAKSGGANIKWLLGDNGCKNGPTYAQNCWNAMDATNQGKIVAMSYHGWNAATNTANITADYNFAQSIGKPLWCMEVGEDPATPGNYDTWAFASQTAKNYYYHFKYGKTARCDYWQYMRDYRLTDANGTTFTPCGHMVDMLNTGIPNSLDLINSANTGGGAWNVAFKHATDGRTAVFFINTGATQNITINNLPTGTYTLRRCSSTQDNVQIGTYTVGSNGTVTLNSVPTDSVNVFFK